MGHSASSIKLNGFITGRARTLEEHTGLFGALVPKSKQEHKKILLLSCGALRHFAANNTSLSSIPTTIDNDFNNDDLGSYDMGLLPPSHLMPGSSHNSSSKFRNTLCSKNLLHANLGRPLAHSFSLGLRRCISNHL
jgi:hypothetical protein